MQGHISSAVNLPISKMFDDQALELLPDERLAQILGDAGIDQGSTVIVYDEYDGQRAAMLAWVLEYLGHGDVRVLSVFVEGWVQQGLEVLYRPVKPEQRLFHPKRNRGVRVFASDLVTGQDHKLLDLRSEEEFRGLIETDHRSGHLPGAVNLPWTNLIGSSDRFLRPREELESLTAALGVRSLDSIVTYCSTGPRAALGYIALQQLGYAKVRLYDGSFSQWSRRSDLPVENER